MKLLILSLLLISCAKYEEVIQIDYECHGKKSTHKEALVYSASLCDGRLRSALANLSSRCENMTITNSFCGSREVKNDLR